MKFSLDELVPVLNSIQKNERRSGLSENEGCTYELVLYTTHERKENDFLSPTGVRTRATFLKNPETKEEHEPRASRESWDAGSRVVRSSGSVQRAAAGVARAWRGRNVIPETRSCARRRRRGGRRKAGPPRARWWMEEILLHACGREKSRGKSRDRFGALD